MSNILTVSISGNSVNVVEGTLQLKSRVDDKDSCTFTVRDDSGTAAYVKGQPVVVSDSVLGTIFSGFINKPTMSNLYPNPTNFWSMDCVNKFVVAAKKAAKPVVAGKKKRGGKHVNQPSGAIAANQIQEYVEPEGVTGNFGLDWSELQQDWASGTQSGVVAATNTSTGNAGAGDLELASTGTPYTYSTTVNFTPSNPTIVLSGTASAGYANAYTYRQVWAGSQVIAANDQFQYIVWISGNSPQIMAIADFMCSDGTVFSSTNVLDLQGLSSAPTTDLSTVAKNQWYSRSFVVPGALVGKTIKSVMVGLTGTNEGTYTAYFNTIQYFISASLTTVSFFSGTVTNVQEALAGYTNVSMSVANAFTSSTIQQSYSPGNFGNVLNIVQGSQVSWTPVLPAGCTVLVETSIDGAASYQTATSGSAYPNLLPGMVGAISFNNPFLDFRVTLTLGTDPTVSASLSDFQIIVNPSYTSSKVDYTTQWISLANFNTGTYTNTAYGSSVDGTLNGLSLTGKQTTWANLNNVGNQTLFGSSSPAQSYNNNRLQLSTATGTDVRSRLDFIGSNWQNFTAEVDIFLPAANVQSGIVYRCTNWGNSNDSYAYSAAISTAQVLLGRGTNSTGAGSFTSVASASLTLAANSTHRLKIVINGSTHQIYVDGILLITATDSTYSAAGNVGLRVYNASGSTQSGLFNNFGIANALSGTWQSASTSIASAGTYGASIVMWDTDQTPDSTTAISVQSSVDGGSTFQSVSNGGSISGLTAGQLLAGKTLILKATISANNAPVVAFMQGLSVWILGQYSSTGTRSTAPIVWDSANRANVASGWGTATNGQTYTQVGTGATDLASNELQISNTTGDVNMEISGASGTDLEGTVRLAISASTMVAGVDLRYVDPNNYFRLQISTTTVSIVGMIRGLSFTIASTPMAITVNTFYRARFNIAGSGPTTFQGRVWADGLVEPQAWTLTGAL